MIKTTLPDGSHSLEIYKEDLVTEKDILAYVPNVDKFKNNIETCSYKLIFNTREKRDAAEQLLSKLRDIKMSDRGLV